MVKGHPDVLSAAEGVPPSNGEAGDRLQVRQGDGLGGPAQGQLHGLTKGGFRQGLGQGDVLHRVVKLLCAVKSAGGHSQPDRQIYAAEGGKLLDAPTHVGGPVGPFHQFPGGLISGVDPPAFQVIGDDNLIRTALCGAAVYRFQGFRDGAVRPLWGRAAAIAAIEELRQKP